MKLSTPWSRDLGLEVPIVNAPMGGVAGGRLARAVTEAGGVGMIGMGTAASADALRTELAELGTVDGPFGIGFVDWVMRREPEMFDVALAANPTMVSVSFGDDFSWVEGVHSIGALAVTQVYDSGEAVRAQEAGVDILVARGAEGGGHGAPTMSMLPVLEAVLDAVTIPVLAAGGISSPRSLAAVLAAGASGAWVGTLLSACPESMVSDTVRDSLIEARGSDTVLTSAFDVALGHDWPSRFPCRVLRNDFTDRQESDNADELIEALRRSDPRYAPIDAGQGVDAIREVQTVANVIDALCGGAAELLGR